MSKVLFFQPHPDDLELNCGHIIHFLANSPKKHVIKIVSATKGEFGLPGPEFDKYKGCVLANVRTRELFSALKIQGIPEDNIIFLNYIDGYVPFNQEIVEKVRNILNEEKPDLVFCPEPLYT